MPAFAALLLGSVLVVLLLVPWVAVQYRRRGSLGFGPTVIAIATVIYGLAIVTYTMLPLPDDVTALCAAGGAGRQWHLGQFLTDIADGGGWSLRNPAVLQVVFNVLLFVPLGMLVRYVLLRGRPVAGIAAAVVVGLAVSALIETTQLTGNWFLYPCSYRVFDVDDLLANTTGALIGGIIAPLLALVPGQRQVARSDEPRPVRAPRRLLGMFCDVLTGWLMGWIAAVAVNVAGYVADFDADPAQLVVGYLPAAVHLLVILVAGRTIGEAAVRLRPIVRTGSDSGTDPDSGAVSSSTRPGFIRRILRWALGIGGWWILLQIDIPGTRLAAILLTAVSLVAVWTTRGRRGFAAALSRTEIADDRAVNR